MKNQSSEGQLREVHKPQPNAQPGIAGTSPTHRQGGDDPLLASQGGSSAEEHHAVRSAPISANASFTSEESGGGASDGGYRSSNDDSTPEHSTRSRHHHHHQQQRGRRRRAKSDKKDSNEESTEVTQDAGSCPTQTGDPEHDGRCGRLQRRYSRPELEAEDSDGSPVHPNGNQHGESNSCQGIDGDGGGGDEDDSQADHDEGHSSGAELNPDGSQPHLFQRVYRQPRHLSGRGGTEAQDRAGAAGGSSAAVEPGAQQAREAPQSGATNGNTTQVAQVHVDAVPSILVTVGAPASTSAEVKGRLKAESTPLAPAPPVDVSSSSSVGGHHLSVTTGRTFMKQSGSHREERFYELIQPYQEELVRRTLARWYHQKKQEQAAAQGNPASVDSTFRPTRSTTLSSSESLDELLAEMEEEERRQNATRGQPHSPGSSCGAEGHVGCPFCPDDKDKGSSCASANEERANVEAQWWREKPRRYKRVNIVAYEAQRRAFSTPATSASPASHRVSPLVVAAAAAGTAAESPAHPPPLQSSVPSSAKRSDVATPNVSAHGTPLSSKAQPTGTFPSPAGAATADVVGAAGDADMTSLFELPPDNVYTADKDRALRLLARFVPRFHGVRRVPLKELAKLTGGVVASQPAPATTVVVPDSAGAAAAGAAGAPPPPPPSKPAAFQTTNTASNKPHAVAAAPTDADNENSREGDDGGVQICQMIALEDVCYGFVHPCVLDMKMGQRQYGMHPSPEKKLKKEHRCRISTSGQYGIRLAGFRCWNEQTQTYESKGKRQCRSFTLAEVKQELSAFFQHSRALERKFGERLEELRVVFAQQNVIQFFTSSLLFVYDAARPLETCRLVMVDFAFTYERKELAQGGDPDAVFEYDIGYLKALDTLLALLA